MNMRIVLAFVFWSLANVTLVLFIQHQNDIYSRTIETPAPAQSWDQEHLKAGDYGCPTAIYVAPKGVLEQCP
jgi:hypothetical protein